ncbi:MAG TPA: serine/threonine-protein kinase [Kofleriaceae bacterium]|nr:serine/threonine-protein kinase [Kofleriaceae bacterium]
MAEVGLTTQAIQWLRGSGLDTSGGDDFIQERIAIFARLISLISLAFLVVNLVTGVAFDIPIRFFLTSSGNVAHVTATLFIALVWLICRRGLLSMALLELIDAAAVVGTCAAWAFLVDARFPGSVQSAVTAVALTTLARAILVPSTASRTLRLGLLTAAPTLVTMRGWLDTMLGQRAPMPGEPYGPWLTVIFQVLLLGTVIAMATVATRILYDLRRSVREARELGQYALEEKLGAGGMGEVWRARHRFLVRAAAIKLIRPDLLDASRGDPGLPLRRFEREALATAALRSPHTVQLYDFGQAEDGTLFYVMELLLGIDLEKLVARFGPVPPERAVHILVQVCQSLDEAHQNGLTHRDIKPANIFVNPVGSELDFVKVLDFGLVRLRPAETGSDQIHLSADRPVGGTPAYTAPEIARGQASYDHRVDIYAVGCVGYWLLTGKLVFEGDSVMKMVIDHAHSPPPRPQTRTDQAIPAELERIILDCLEKDPARRPPTAAALGDRLAGCPLPRPWTRERAEDWWRTHMPQPEPERQVADVLLSHEGSPASVLRPRRSTRPVGSAGSR